MLHCKFLDIDVDSLLICQGWIFYAQSEFRHVPENLRYLRSVTELALTCLEYHVEDAMDLVAEVLENYPTFFETKHQEMLWSAIAGPWGLEILRDLDAETVSLARIIVAYGQILLDSKVLYREHETAHNRQVMCKATFEEKSTT
jgi:hypothetical protein